MIDLSLGAKKAASSEERIYKALEVLKDFDPYDNSLGEFDCSSKHMNDQAEEAIDELLAHAPKLIEAYAELWEMCMELITAVEKERAERTLTLASGKLVIPK
jgi:hypothetical protein